MLEFEIPIDIAKSLFDQQKYQEIIDYCHQILSKENNSSIDALKLIAKSFLAIRKMENARLFLNKALNIKPDDYESIKDIGNTYHAIGDTNTAKIYFQKAIAINGSYAPALSNLGSLELTRGANIGWLSSKSW